MKRMFWFAAGTISGVVASRKATKKVRQATPSGIASNLGDALSELASAIGSFGADVRAGMAEREEQLHETVAQTSGVRTRYIEPGSRGRHSTTRPRR